MQRALEWLLAGPWRLVLVVALVAGIPILVIGEFSADDTRQRVRSNELRVGAEAADSVFVSAPVILNSFLVGTLIAEVDLRFVPAWLVASRSPTQDVYVLDERGRLVGQASRSRRSADPEFLRDLSRDPVVSATTTRSSRRRQGTATAPIL